MSTKAIVVSLEGVLAEGTKMLPNSDVMFHGVRLVQALHESYGTIIMLSTCSNYDLITDWISPLGIGVERIIPGVHGPETKMQAMQNAAATIGVTVVLYIDSDPAACKLAQDRHIPTLLFGQPGDLPVDWSFESTWTIPPEPDSEDEREPETAEEWAAWGKWES